MKEVSKTAVCLLGLWALQQQALRLGSTCDQPSLPAPKYSFNPEHVNHVNPCHLADERVCLKQLMSISHQ